MIGKNGFLLKVVPIGTDGNVREIPLSLGGLVALATTGFLVVALLSAVLLTWGRMGVDRVAHHRLQQENRILQGELSQMQLFVDELSEQMNQIALHDEALRLMAELEPLADDLRQVGVGGSYRDFNHQILLASSAAAGLTKEIQGRINQLSREAKLQSESMLEVHARLEESEVFLRGYPSLFPIDRTKYRTYLTSPFGNRVDPLYGTPRFHSGNDIGAPHGTPVWATADGMVDDFEGGIDGFRRIGLGNFVKINHGNGYITYYGHLARLAPAISRKGVRVKRGDVIGYVGNTGRSQGTHLHYEIAFEGKSVNPWYHYYTDRMGDVTGRREYPVYQATNQKP